MNDKNTDPRRRQALKKILVGSSVVGASAVVPDKWVKPVVDAVVLPAHAQPSPAFMLPAGANWAGGSGRIGFGSTVPKSEEGLAQRLLDRIVPEAHAGNNVGDCPSGVFLCLSTVSADKLNVQLAVSGLRSDSATATVVNGIIRQPFTIGDYKVTGTLINNGLNWEGRVMGPCPGKANVNNVAPDVVFTGERIEVAALQLALAVGNGFNDLDVRYTALLNEPCGLPR